MNSLLFSKFTRNKQHILWIRKKRNYEQIKDSCQKIKNIDPCGMQVWQTREALDEKNSGNVQLTHFCSSFLLPPLPQKMPKTR